MPDSGLQFAQIVPRNTWWWRPAQSQRKRPSRVRFGVVQRGAASWIVEVPASRCGDMILNHTVRATFDQRGRVRVGPQHFIKRCASADVEPASNWIGLTVGNRKRRTCQRRKVSGRRVDAVCEDRGRGDAAVAIEHIHVLARRIDCNTVRFGAGANGELSTSCSFQCPGCVNLVSVKAIADDRVCERALRINGKSGWAWIAGVV